MTRVIGKPEVYTLPGIKAWLAHAEPMLQEFMTKKTGASSEAGVLAVALLCIKALVDAHDPPPE